MRKLLASVAIVLSVISSPKAAAPIYTYDIPKLYPAVFNLWEKGLATYSPSVPEGDPPSTASWPSWLTDLNGVASPLTEVKIGTTQYRFGTICMPHDCGDNQAGLLFTPNQTRVIAVVNMAGVPTPIGPMSQREYLCINEFIDTQGRQTTCSR